MHCKTIKATFLKSVKEETRLPKRMQIREKELQARLAYMDHLYFTRKFCKRSNNLINGRKQDLI